MSDHEANELRLVANEIMRKLYDANQRDQLNILKKYAEVAIEHIDQATKTRLGRLQKAVATERKT